MAKSENLKENEFRDLDVLKKILNRYKNLFFAIGKL